MVFKSDVDKTILVNEWELQLSEFLAIPEWGEAFERVFPNEDLEELVDEIGEYEIFETILKEDDRIWTLDWADKDDIDSPMRITQWKIKNKSFKSEDEGCSSCGEDLEDYGSIQCSDCGEDGCGACSCSDCDRCDDCCLCKCSVCGDKDISSYGVTQTRHGNVCSHCYDWCYGCSGRKHPKEMYNRQYCQECADTKPHCVLCDEISDYDGDFNACDECSDQYCENCSENSLIETKTGEKLCTQWCAGSKSAENFGPECITCASDMSDQPLWGCECCGMLVGTKGEHEGCGFNEDGEVMCNLCYTGQCDCSETFEAMGWHDPRWAGDREAVESKFSAMYPTYEIDETSLDYLVYQGGASNKYHVFFLATDPAGNYHAFNAYGRIGYSPTLHHNAGPGTKSSVTQAISKKKQAKSKKGYKPYGAEGEDGKLYCDRCDNLADFNFQDIDVRWDIEDGEFTGKYELKNHLGDYNDFLCLTCAEIQGMAAEAESCEHDWKYQGSYGDSYWEGYGVDATEVEYGIAEYYCSKCDSSKEVEIKEAENDEIAQVELHNPIETGAKMTFGSMLAVIGFSAIGGFVLGLFSRNNGDE